MSLNGKQISVKLSRAQGDNLFGDSIFKLIPKDELQYIFKEINRLFSQQLGPIKDYRFSMILSCVFLEKEIDQILVSFFPKLCFLEKNSQLSFSLKINMLKSLSVVPNYVSNSLDGVRKIRNRLAHSVDDNYDLDSLGSFNETICSHLEILLTDDWTKNESYLSNLHEIMYSLLTILRIYAYCCERYNNYVRGADFLEKYISHIVENIDSFKDGEKIF